MRDFYIEPRRTNPTSIAVWNEKGRLLARPRTLTSVVAYLGMPQAWSDRTCSRLR